MEISKHYLPNKAFLRFVDQFDQGPCVFFFFLVLPPSYSRFSEIFSYAKYSLFHQKEAQMPSVFLNFTNCRHLHPSLLQYETLETDKSPTPSFITFHCPSFRSHRESFTLTCLFCGAHRVPVKFIYALPEIP